MYGVCCLLGLGTLLPWNVFITEKQYFDVRVQQPPTQPALADNFENIIVVSFQMLCVDRYCSSLLSRTKLRGPQPQRYSPKVMRDQTSSTWLYLCRLRACAAIATCF